MQLHLIKSDKIYNEILETPIEKKRRNFERKSTSSFYKKIRKTTYFF